MLKPELCKKKEPLFFSVFGLYSSRWVPEFVPLYRCAGAGHLLDDILYYSKELAKLPVGDDEHQAYLMDVGVKALRLDLFSVFAIIF